MISAAPTNFALGPSPSGLVSFLDWVTDCFVDKRVKNQRIMTMSSSPSDRPLVSVIMPVYNEAAHITQVVRSLLNQSSPDFDLEILTIDGPSNDGTYETLLQLAGADPRVRLLVNERRKTPFAFNIGLQNAKGEYVC